MEKNMDSELEQYGYRILPSGRFFSIAKGAELGVVHSKKRGRHQYHSTSGALLASGMNPVAFVQKFWYAKKQTKNPDEEKRTVPTHLRRRAGLSRDLTYWGAHEERQRWEDAGDAAQAEAWQDMLDRWHFLPIAKKKSSRKKNPGKKVSVRSLVAKALK